MEESLSSQSLLGRGAVVLVGSRILQGSSGAMFDAGAAAIAAVLVRVECWQAPGAARATGAAEAESCRTAGTTWATKAGIAKGCCAAWAVETVNAEGCRTTAAEWGAVVRSQADEGLVNHSLGR